jgi:hypothetical protein
MPLRGRSTTSSTSSAHAASMPPASASLSPLPGMRLPAALAVLGAAAMTCVILWAAASGDGGAQLAALLALPWGVVSLVDLYVGFSLFSGWIWFRERSSAVAAAWTVAMMCLGFAAGSAYALLALRASRGDWARFWLGARACAAAAAAAGGASLAAPLLHE